MTSLCRSVAAALTLMLGTQALAQAPEQQQQATQQKQMDLFRKGFSACLEPKGYTVK